jgi:hypothetical protein
MNDYEELREQLVQESEAIPEASENSIEKSFPLLFEHFRSVNLNCQHQRNSFPKNMQDFYFLMSLMGESFYTILVDLFGFPSYRTTKRYRNKTLEKLGLNKESFVASPENILKNCRCFIGEGEDSRSILSIDAVSLNSYASISREGKVEGLLDCDEISSKET